MGRWVKRVLPEPRQKDQVQLPREQRPLRQCFVHVRFVKERHPQEDPRTERLVILTHQQSQRRMLRDVALADFWRIYDWSLAGSPQHLADQRRHVQCQCQESQLVVYLLRTQLFDPLFTEDPERSWLGRFRQQLRNIQNSSPKRPR